MLYTGIRPLQVYKSQEYMPLPKGERVGYDNAIFLLSSSRQKSNEILLNSFLAYHISLYKNYFIDLIYNQRIGRKRILINNSTVFKKEFSQTNFPYSLKMIIPALKHEVLEKGPNIIVDLGEWNSLYFKNRLTVSQASICDDYISFIASKINSSEYNNYSKVIYIDINDWFIENYKIFGLSKLYLDNPVAILLLSIYKYPDTIKKLGIIDIIIADSKNKQFIKLNYTDLVKDNFVKIKSKLLSITGLSEKASSNIDKESDSLPETPETELTSKIMANDKNKIILDSRTNIINTLKKNIIGEVEDITSEVIDNEDDNIGDTSIKTESKYNDEIDEVANTYIDENPDILSSDPESASKEIEKEIIKKVYVAKFMPERSDKEIEKMNALYGNQEQILGKPSYHDLESKIIDESDLSHTITTSNPDIIISRFKNFDNNYNKKKLNKDIDEAVSIVSQTNHPIFVIGKEEEDTSDQLNLKKTITYHLQDEKGSKYSIKLDIPIIIDDKYVYLNGNKKILQHQLVLKPLVKTGPDTVQIVAWYNKIFITRKNQDDLISSSLRKYLITNSDKYKVKLGNAVVKNTNIETPIEFDIIASRIYEFTINDNVFILDIHELLKTLDAQGINYKRIDLDKNLILGYNKKSKEPIYMDRRNDIYSNILFKYIPDEDKNDLKKSKISRLMYSQCKIMDKEIPLVLFMLFCEGFTSVMKKANIEYKFVTRKEAKEYDNTEWGKIEVSDGIVLWKRYPLQNSLLMNGMNILPTNLYSFEELDSKDTYIFMLSQFYTYASMAFNLDQYRDFMIDSVTKEILMDFNLPTDLVSLLAYANAMLRDNSFRQENDHRNIRIRSNELIPYFTYKTITSAYNAYRKTQHKAKPTKLNIKNDSVLKAIKTSQLTEDSSVLNAVLELEKNRAVTYKGKMGINLDQAMGLDKRAYDPTMLGILGISTPDDSSVGILRQLTLEPKITSTRGYLEITDDVNKLNSANLLTPAELLTPMAVQHDDPTRTAMTYKQSKYMLPVEDSTPVLIGNRVESIIPYHMSREFTIIAKDDGEIIEVNNGIIIIKYKDGTYDSIDTNTQVKKNASSGFFIETRLECNKNVGDKVKRDEVIAYNDKTFSRNSNDNSVSMNLGVLTKIAVLPNWDLYEDSAPVTEKLSKQLASTMINEKEIVLNKDAYVEKIVNVGDKVKVGDPLIVFDSFPDDPDAAKFLEMLREDLKEDIIESSITTIKSKYTGEIADIKIYSTVELDELSPTLQKLVKTHYDKLSKKDKLLEKYKNPGDTKFYKCGQLITEAPVKLIPNYEGKIKGIPVGEGVLIVFYIKYKDIAATGDKGVALAALKSINSHVIDKGMEPYSEFEPNEEISTLLSPLSISARKTPSIFYNMFGNKLLIYLKRQSKEKYLSE